MTPIEGRPILTAAAMRAAEEAHGDLTGLMARAGAGVATAAHRLAAGAEVLVLCGPGNNGGDGYVAAAALLAAGHPVRVAAMGEPSTQLAGQARQRWSGPVENLGEAQAAPVLVDALFGTGLARPLADDIAGPLRHLADAAHLSIAVDLPSGLSTDTGRALSNPPFVDVTLALGAVKPAHLLQPGARFCGSVRLLDVGLTVDGDAQVLARPDLPTPGPDAHKYTRGLVAVIGGRMAGASELAGVAALRSGAGYVLHLGEGSGAPHALVRTPWSAEALDDERIGAIVIGPGLGRDDGARAKLHAALASGRPLVIDGDALHLLDPGRLPDVPVILTPHAGEFKALFGDEGDSKIDRTHAAAARSGSVVAFKGPDTVIAAPDGRVRVSGDASGWLSTAGTGDVLAGACGAMLASGLDPLAAAAAAVWLHGQAARACGRAFIADDLADKLSHIR